MRSRAGMILAVVLVGLVARAGHAVAVKDHPYWDFVSVWNNSDMYQFALWGNHLADGDWLDRETFRPEFGWQRNIAPQEVWNSWFGAHVYYQPPLYPYLIAATLTVTDSLDAFRLGQLLLGALNCGLIALLAARLFSPAAGWIAGLTAALYAPFIVYDLEVLRGTLTRTTQLALLLSLASMLDEHYHRRWRLGTLIAGGAFGLAYLTDPAILLFGPPALFWAWWCAARSRTWNHPGWRRTAGVPAVMAAGVLLALTPLMARNRAVGAPLLSSTTRGPLAFVMGNAPDANPAGAFLPGSTATILSASGYGMLATMRETLRLYGGDYVPLVLKQWIKMKALYGSFEVPDNPSFYYAARISPAVRWGIPFLPVAAFGLAGLVLLLPAAFRSPRDALLPLYVLAWNGLFLLAHVVSRYRQPLAMALIILGANALVCSWARIRSSEGFSWRLLVYPAAVGLFLILLPKGPPPGYGYDRPAEYVLAAAEYEKRGEIDAAVDEFSRIIERVGQEQAYQYMTGRLLYHRGAVLARAGRHHEAIASFEKALQEDPEMEDAKTALSYSRRAVGQSPR